MTTTDTYDQAPVARLDLSIRPDDGTVSMRTVALGIPGAVTVVLEVEADDESPVPAFVIKIDAGGVPGSKDEAMTEIAQVLMAAGVALHDYIEERS